MRHYLEPFDLAVFEIDRLLSLAQGIKESPRSYAKKCDGKILATLFYEPSTRTRLSFESAMLRLGGSVLGFSSPSASSVSKGESVSDTISTVSRYADIIAIRTVLEGAPTVAAQVSRVPVINAGDGGHQHPTQTLTDLLTILSEKGGLHNLTIGLCGDLLYGRTVHSLIKALSRYGNNRFVLISPPELKVPKYIIQSLEENQIPFREVSSLEGAIPELDVLYMTRIQRERFTDEAQYLRLKDSYILDLAKLAHAKSDMIILHPLPRVNEICVEVDSDPRALYFEQTEWGVYARMALILTLLEIDEPMAPVPNSVYNTKILNHICKNPRCISSVEQEIKSVFKTTDNGRTYHCLYCQCES